MLTNTSTESVSVVNPHGKLSMDPPLKYSLGQAPQSDGRFRTKGGDEELPAKHDATATRTPDGGSVGETPQPA